MDSLIIPAFLAGLLTFLAPCTLPLVPGYLGFISDVSLNDLQNPERAGATRRKIFRNGLFFILGFSAIFILFGTVAASFGNILSAYRLWLTRVGGGFVILFGLFMLNVIQIPFLTTERKLKVPIFLQRGRSFSSLALGTAFGLGWTPCVGPVLGSILTLAATGATVGQGALLLAVFSAGLAVPFLVIAAGIGSASRYLQKVNPYLKTISVIGGLFLVFLGVLLLTNSFSLWIAYFYRLFDFINYDALLNYL